MCAFPSAAAPLPEGHERLASVLRLLAANTRASDVALDDPTLAERVAHGLVGALADACVVDVVDDEGVPDRRVALHVDPTRAALLDSLFLGLGDEAPQAHVLASGRTLAWSNVRDVPLVWRAALEPLDARSVLFVPAVARGAVLGVVTLLATRDRASFDAFDLAVAREVCARLALSLEHARELRRARQEVRSRDDLVAMVSHDLRDPLSAIGAGASVLRRIVSPEDATFARAVDLVARNVVRMQQLVGNLLDLARHDSAGLKLDIGEHAPRAIVYDALDMLAPVAGQKGVQLEARMPAELPPVRCDRDATVRVLTNIIGNAIKFTPTGGAIRVRLEPGPRDLRVGVSDTGPGIARTEVSHVFDRFWQAKRASRTGAGLGLAIAKAIVEETGGSIWVDSHVGVGTTFYFTIPLA